MMKTKAEIINIAYSMLLRTGVTVGASASDIELALNRLEDVMYELQSQGVNTGYNFEEVPDVNSLSGLAMWMNQGVASLLALRVAPDFGVTMTPELMTPISIATSNLSARLAQVNQTNYAGRMPIGSGQKLAFPYRRFYGAAGVYPQTPETLQAVLHDTTHYVVDFSEGQLRTGEIIASYTTEASNGLLLANNANTDSLIEFDLTFNKGGAQRVIIRANGDMGTVSVRSLLFNVFDNQQIGALNA
jgi:hypothetical protein